jgi:sugar lactone lactonase YvrE
MRMIGGRWRRVVLAAICVLGIISSVSAQDNGRGRHKQLYAVPPPSKVVIDGKLDDWDLSGQIEMFVVQATRGTMNAKFAVMYDTEAIYLGADVNDPSPMMNMHDPQAEPERGWDADSCQFRLTTDPKVGYPILDESTFKYKGKGDSTETRDDIVHLTLWNYTQANAPQMAMQLGMTYREPANAPQGIVPPEQFQAKYLKRADGTGYTFEYRIPWKTLNAKGPLKGGDIVAGTVQFNYSRPDGLKTAGGAAWAYDLMREAGFPFQSTKCWGKLVFSPTGNVDRKLVLEGVPQDRPLPLDFTYTLPEDTECTVQLFNEKNENVRMLVPQQARLGGKNIERWDGCEDNGNLLPAGSYRWRGIYHAPVKAEYRFSVHNSGQPPFPTIDNKGGWGGDHGAPTGCSAFAGGMLLAWEGAEFGWGVIRVDAEGRKQWGIKNTAVYIANDGKRFFIYEPAGFQAAEGIKALDLADGRPLSFNGQSEVKAPAGGDKEQNKVTGLACANGKLYVSYGARNLIGVFDSASGKLEAQWAVPQPGVLAVSLDGSLVVVSEGKVVSCQVGSSTGIDSNRQQPSAAQHGVLIGDHLDDPQGIAVAADGTIYVANCGKLQNVSVFDSAGKYLRSIGQAGGRPAKGRYEANGMFKPDGLAVDAKGRLWVAEAADAPKRISVWDAKSGAFQKEFFGGCDYFAYGMIDPAQPDEMLVHNMLWKIDWKNYKVTPLTTVWRKTSPDMVPYPSPGASSSTTKILTAANGRQYMYGNNYAHYSGLFYRDGELFKPAMSKIQVGNSRIGPAGIPFMDNDRTKYPQGEYFWQDQNGDCCVQPAEVIPLKGTKLGSFNIARVFPDLTVLLASGYLLKPVSMENGIPKYDLAKAEKYPLPVGNFGAMPMEDGGIVSYTASDKGQLARFGRDGQPLWSYNGITRWQRALNLGVTGPGKLWGMTQCMGKGGDFLVFQTYMGPNHVFRSDGIYVGALLKDGRLMLNRGQDEGQPEGQGGYFGRLTIYGQDRYFTIGGGQDARVWEVTGLDTIKDLPGGTYVHTPELAAKAEQAQRDYKMAMAAGNRIVIAKDLAAAKAVQKELENGWGFKAKVARDAKNLLLDYEVVSATPLLNTVADPKLLFKGGNCLDIQLENSLGEPVRVLVTQYQKKPFAAVYFPKVKEFKGEPTVLVSPTGKESFDEIKFLENAALTVEKTDKGFRARVALPLEALRLKLEPGQKLKMDLGYIFGNAKGVDKAVRRSYLSNNSFSANVIDDIPNEARLEPKEWGEAEVE